MKNYEVRIGYEVRLYPLKTYEIQAKNEEEAEAIALKKFDKEDEGDLYNNAIECENSRTDTWQESFVDNTCPEVQEIEFIDDEN